MAAFTAVLMVSAPAQSATRERAQEVDVYGLESTLADALHGRDRQQLESLLASDYVLRGTPDVDREMWLQNAVTLCWGDRSDLDVFRTVRHDGVVIAMFELTFYVDPATCRASVLRSLVTDVWVHETDGWKLKVRHAGAPPASSEDIAAQYGAARVLPPTWEVASEFSAVATGGNTSTRTVGLGAELAHRSDGQKTEVKTKFLTSQANEAINARLLIVEGRHGFGMTERLHVFGATSYTRDRFAGVDNRVTATAGAAYAISVPPFQTFTFEGGLGWTAEQRLDRTTLRFATSTGALDYRWTIVPGIELREEATFDADLESLTNWRTSSTTTLNVTLTRVLSLRASHAIDYRHTPVVGFGRSDMRTAMSVVLSMDRRPRRE